MMHHDAVVRILHLPYYIPYARKLISPEIEPVNRTLRDRAGRALYAPDFRWISQQEHLDFFDVLHIHLINFEGLDIIEAALQKCLQQKKRIVFTLHDLFSLYQEEEESYRKKLALLCSYAHVVIALTQASATALAERLKDTRLPEILVVPHGFIVHPDHPQWEKAAAKGDTVEYGLFGAFRPNREIYACVRDWYSGLSDYNARLNVLSTGVRHRISRDTQLHIEETLAFLQSDKQRMRLFIRPHLSDDDIVHFLSTCDVLLLPYLWGSHSGQLELAFDLSLLPLVSRVGFFADQWQVVQAHIPEPIWFHWSNTGESCHEAGITDALLMAQQRKIYNQPLSTGEEWRQYRLHEHENILRAYLQAYRG